MKAHSILGCVSVEQDIYIHARMSLVEHHKTDRGFQQGLPERAGKTGVRTGRLRGFNCCIQIRNGRVKATQSHPPIGGAQGEEQNKQTQVATRKNFNNFHNIR